MSAACGMCGGTGQVMTVEWSPRPCRCDSCDGTGNAPTRSSADIQRIVELETALKVIMRNELNADGHVRAEAWRDDHVRCAGIARIALDKGKNQAYADAMAEQAYAGAHGEGE